MGCYDTVIIKCPNCNKSFSLQSKSGRCNLVTYTIDNAPLVIIADLNEEGADGRLFCEHCSTAIEISVKFLVSVRIKDTSDIRNYREV